jgi:hypothetical protein
MLIAAGAAPLWMAFWGRERRRAVVLGVCALAGGSAFVVAAARGFITELRDQQLEWAFLERTVSRLPKAGALLSAVVGGGRNLDPFPEFLLKQADKNYTMIDLRQTVTGGVKWPAPGDDLIYYQGMFCYFAFHDEGQPDPITPLCQAVHERYIAEPIVTEDLDTQGFSDLNYAKPPYRIGFYRLTQER